MKRIIYITAALLLSICASAQVTTVSKDGITIAEFYGREGLKFVMHDGEEPAIRHDTVYVKDIIEVHDTTYLKGDDPRNLLPGVYSVNASKKVQFTKSNLFWDGNNFRFEKNQTDYQTSWDANHVSHFYWTKESSKSYAANYSEKPTSVSDVPYFGESTRGITVEGTSGLFVLSRYEWEYIFDYRKNASKLKKLGVTVTNNGTTYTNCLILAPDGFTGTLQSSYTLEEINSLGLVCMPAAGYRNGGRFQNGGSTGYYWSSDPCTRTDDEAYGPVVSSGGIALNYIHWRKDGFSVRLVVWPLE